MKFCYVVIEHQYDENGFIPSCVKENEYSHFPMTGNGDGATPWYWGKTFIEAEAVCKAQNEKMGLTENEILHLIHSSMFPRA